MTDKVQKIREEVEKRYEYWREKESNSHSIESEIRMSECQHLLLMLDSMQEEPVSEDLEDATNNYCVNVRKGYPRVMDETDRYICNAFKAGAQWQKTKDESATKDLGEYINELSKQFPEVSFAKLSRIAVRVAKWQKEHFEKERLKHCDALTAEQAQIESDFVVNHLKKNNRMPTFLDAIEYGMKKMKEQMMAKAVDGDITFDYYGDDDKTYGCIAHDSFCLEDFGLKDREKVKMILIKED